MRNGNGMYRIVMETQPPLPPGTDGKEIIDREGEKGINGRRKELLLNR